MVGIVVVVRANDSFYGAWNASSYSVLHPRRSAAMAAIFDLHMHRTADAPDAVDDEVE